MKILELRDNWSTLSTLLDEVLALPAKERVAWIASLSGTDLEHRQTLIELLGMSASGMNKSDLIDVLPAFDLPVGAGVDADVAAVAAGQLVGPYRLIAILGRGGMGSVWLAERADAQPRRKIALKLPHLGWAPGLTARLARERDILASLEHPNIARLYDAGVDQLGRPYLALEYVDGIPINDYCETHKLALRERLRLLLLAAAAVSYAHTRLIVHRDLKPSNILVTHAGDVRLLDFGIAKLLQDDADAEDVTRMTGHALTPDYSSPEQIRGESIGTPSDVYSLGVVAYELLAQVRPYRLRDAHASSLSEAISRVQVPPASRAAVDASVRNQLRGDLDAILNNALKKDSAERYPTVAALADDLRRHLDHLPVTVRPDGFAYRWRKFIARNTLQVGAGAMVIAAILAGTAASLWQAHQARMEAARAEQVKSFALSMLESADTDAGAGAATTALDLLQAARQRVENELAGRPAIAAELMTAIGYGLIGQDRPEDAAGVLKKAIELSAQANGPDDARTLGAQVIYGEALYELGRNDEAIALLKPAVERARRLGDAHAEVGAWRWLSSAQIDTGDFKSGLASARAAVAALPSTPAADRRALLDAIEAHLGLANALNSGGLSGVVDETRTALNLMPATTGGHSTSREWAARALLGRGLVRDGHVAAGLRELDAAYTGIRALLGPDHQDTEIIASYLGNARMEAGDVNGAVAAYQAALDAVIRREAGRGSSALAYEHYGLALALATARERERALPHFDAAARLFAETDGPSAPLTLRVRSARALALARLGRLDEAEREFANLASSVFADKEKAMHEGRLAELRSLQGRHGEAVALARASMEGLKATPSETTQAQSQSTLGAVLLAAGRPDEAVAPLERSIALFREAQLQKSPDRIEAAAALERARAALASSGDRPGSQK
jgi:serine/threonine-protein kinase